MEGSKRVQRFVCLIFLGGKILTRLHVFSVSLMRCCSSVIGIAAQNSPQDFLYLQNGYRTAMGLGILSWNRTSWQPMPRLTRRRGREIARKFHPAARMVKTSSRGQEALVPRIRSSPGSERSGTTTAPLTNARVEKRLVEAPYFFYRDGRNCHPHLQNRIVTVAYRPPLENYLQGRATGCPWKWGQFPVVGDGVTRL